MRPAQEFYDDLADDYDVMTSFDTRIGAERRALAPIVAEYAIRRAADMGCGSGVHALALAGLGVEARGVDLSDAMVASACRHAEALELHASFETGDMRSTLPFGDEGCDAVLCLGNTLPHLRDEGDLIDTLSTWRRMLRPGGLLLLQTVNYDRVLLDRQRVLGTRMTPGGCIVRFYDFLDGELGFNVLLVSAGEGGTSNRLISTTLRPFGRDALLRATERAGYTNVRSHAGLDRAQWSLDSAAVLITAER